ncbi:MAG: glycosyltransferase [Candidatus Marinimicrobia bacterium]|nr:glycosyltransferase [Candidatus Neomarinimicrobiota bacterium]MCF7828734.1 glycosyltransferase [Candidatus Neomarinimicrobiota bacterium]MCF7880651.1 glycosyltransferase [Candidatus Neomarinimicrobiota bacterium]
MHLNIDYIASININGNSGKEKATGEKLSALESSQHSVDSFVLRKESSTLITKLFVIIFLELNYLFKKIFSKNPPDLIFTRSTFGFSEYIIGNLFHVPVIREIHGDFIDEANIFFEKNRVLKLFSVLYSKYINFFLKKSNGIIFNNDLLEKHFTDNYRLNGIQKITISNGCSIDKFYPIDPSIARLKLGLDPDIIYLLFIGSVNKWHGVEYLIDTQNEISSLSNRFRLLIVGANENSYVNKLKGKSSANRDIIFKGRVSADESLLYINASNISLIPVNPVRVSPGSPLKLFDTIACGKPVITQINTPGYSDITQKYNIGYTCNFFKPRESALKIIEISKKIDYEEFRNHNRLVAEKYLSWNKIIEKWISFGLLVKKGSKSVAY